MQQRMFGASSSAVQGRSRETESENRPQEPQRGHGPKAQPTLPTVEERYELPPSSRPAASATERWRRWVSRPRTRRSRSSSGSLSSWCTSGRIIAAAAMPRCRRRRRARRSRDPRRSLFAGLCRRGGDCRVRLSPAAERQVRMMRHEDRASIPQTLWDQLEALSRVLRPLYDAIRAHILLSDVLHADETHLAADAKGEAARSGTCGRWRRKTRSLSPQSGVAGRTSRGPCSTDTPAWRWLTDMPPIKLCSRPWKHTAWRTA